MSLTPEEKKKIFEEEKTKAKEILKVGIEKGEKEPVSKTGVLSKKVIIISFSIIAIIFIVVAILITRSNRAFWGSSFSSKNSVVQKEPNKREENAKVIMPNYTILNEEVEDTPIKTQVELRILVSGKLSELGLRVLLTRLYSSIKERKGFKYHNSPTAIGIYAYTLGESKKRDGVWIAMLIKTHTGTEPLVSIQSEYLLKLPWLNGK